MRFLIISDAWHPQVNGVVRTYEHLSKELVRRGHEVMVIGPRDFKFRLPTPGYSEIELALFAYNALKKKIESISPENIHIATEGPLGWAARRFCLENNIEFSTSYHTHFPDYAAKRVATIFPFLYKTVHEWTKIKIRDFHAPATSMLIATQSLEEELKAWGFKTPMHRFSRGINTDMFYPGEKTHFKELKRPVALYVGRVAIEKNIEDFLLMPWEGSKVVVGEGPSLQDLKRKYPDTVFTGQLVGEELATHYRSADLFVFPSRTDTFGIVLIEALASGLPVAAYNVTGPKDIITEDFLGGLHETDLAAAAKLAMSRGDRASRSNHVKTTYTWEHAASQFEEAVWRNADIKYV